VTWTYDRNLGQWTRFPPLREASSPVIPGGARDGWMSCPTKAGVVPCVADGHRVA